MNEKARGGYRSLEGRDPILDLLASGRLATVSLAIAEILSALDCLAIVVLGVYGCFVSYGRGDMLLALACLFGTPVAFMIQFAVLVVFARVKNLGIARCIR